MLKVRWRSLSECLLLIERMFQIRLLHVLFCTTYVDLCLLSRFLLCWFSRCWFPLYRFSVCQFPLFQMSLCRFPLYDSHTLLMSISALLMLIPIIPMAIKWIPIVPLNGFPWHWGQSTILREKYPNREFFLIRVFLYSDWNLRIQSEYRKIRASKKTPY